MSSPNRRPWVYISSPYTKGDVAINVRAQMDAADLLLNLGMVPIAPLYSHFQHIFRPRPYEEWIALDLEIVSRCDVCLRIAAEYEDGKGMAYRQWDSSGADREVEEFERLGKPVLFTIEDVQQWAAAWRTGFRTSNDAATRERADAYAFAARQAEAAARDHTSTFVMPDPMRAAQVPPSDVTPPREAAPVSRENVNPAADASGGGDDGLRNAPLAMPSKDWMKRMCEREGNSDCTTGRPVPPSDVTPPREPEPDSRRTIVHIDTDDTIDERGWDERGNEDGAMADGVSCTAGDPGASVADRASPDGVATDRPGGRGAAVNGLRTERVTLEVTHDCAYPAAEWVLEVVQDSCTDPGESARVVEEATGTDMGNGVTVASTEEVLAMCRETEARLTAERDAARADLATLKGECESIRDRVAELEAAARTTALLAEMRESEWNVASELAAEANAANAGGEKKPPEPRGWLTAEERACLEEAVRTLYKGYPETAHVLRVLRDRSTPPRVRRPVHRSESKTMLGILVDHDNDWISAIREAGWEVAE